MTKKPKIYIAGPMRDVPDFNYPTFRHIGNKLRGLGWDVENPAEIGATFGTPEQINGDKDLLAAVVTAELYALDMCDAICLLPDWHKSEGARRELARALQLGLEIIIAPLLSPPRRAAP